MGEDLQLFIKTAWRAERAESELTRQHKRAAFFCAGHVRACKLKKTDTVLKGEQVRGAPGAVAFRARDIAHGEHRERGFVAFEELLKLQL